jgi:hypothetical protein
MSNRKPQRKAGSSREVPSLAVFILLLQSVLVSLLVAFDPAPRSLHAYVDPGSGALIVQLVLSMVAGFLLSLRKVRDAFHRLLDRSSRE